MNFKSLYRTLLVHCNSLLSPDNIVPRRNKIHRGNIKKTTKFVRSSEIGDIVPLGNACIIFRRHQGVVCVRVFVCVYYVYTPSDTWKSKSNKWHERLGARTVNFVRNIWVIEWGGKYENKIRFLSTIPDVVRTRSRGKETLTRNVCTAFDNHARNRTANERITAKTYLYGSLNRMMHLYG